jgi:hypothetical protein
MAVGLADQHFWKALRATSQAEDKRRRQTDHNR